MPLLLGQRDEVLRVIEAAFPDADDPRAGQRDRPRRRRRRRAGRTTLEDLVVLVEQGHRLDPATVRRTVDMVRHDEQPAEVLSTEVLRPPRGRPVRPKSSGQKRYVDAIRENVITFGIGPAGTGKSWLAVAMAVQALQIKQVDRIILTRPGGGGRRAARVPPRRPDGQGRPVPAAPVGRVARHGRHRERRQAPRAGRGRGRAPGIHARSSATGRPAGADAVGLAADRRPRGRRPRHRLERAADVGARRVPAGSAGGVPVRAQDGAETLLCRASLVRQRPPTTASTASGGGW